MTDQIVPETVTINLNSEQALLALMAIGEMVVEKKIVPDDLCHWHELLSLFLIATNCPTQNAEHFLNNFDSYINGINRIDVDS